MNYSQNVFFKNKMIFYLTYGVMEKVIEMREETIFPKL